LDIVWQANDILVQDVWVALLVQSWSNYWKMTSTMDTWQHCRMWIVWDSCRMLWALVVIRQ
jgi:hypothetical protein